MIVQRTAASLCIFLLWMIMQWSCVILKELFISIGKKRPDLILLDYEMPEMNGKEVLQKLQAEKEYADIPVIFLTSMDNREKVMELLALKPAGYILKPTDSQMLLERVENIIGK